MTECNQCGDCCRVIGVSYTKRKLREGVLEDSEFCVQHWHRISRVEALRRNPHMSGKTPGHFYYECDMFDSDSNKCTARAVRPSVCRGFPWYGREANTTVLDGFFRCSFWADVAEENRPPLVQVNIKKSYSSRT